MVKGIKCIILSLFFVLLASCSTRDNLNNSMNSLTQDELTVSDEEESLLETSSADKEAEKEKLKKSIDESVVIADRSSTFFKNLGKEFKNKVKKVEHKKIIIKPVNDYNRDLHNLSDEEIETFFEDIENDEPIEEGKKYDSKSIKVLMENYKNILKVSSACCVSSVSENLKTNGVSKDSFYFEL